MLTTAALKIARVRSFTSHSSPVRSHLWTSSVFTWAMVRTSSPLNFLMRASAIAFSWFSPVRFCANSTKDLNALLYPLMSSAIFIFLLRGFFALYTRRS